MEVLLPILIAAGVATWVYSDAMARHAAYPVLWGVGTFLLLIVVLPVWLIMRPPKPEAGVEVARPCRYCGAANPAWTRVCQNCGREFGEPDGAGR